MKKDKCFVCHLEGQVKQQPEEKKEECPVQNKAVMNMLPIPVMIKRILLQRILSTFLGTTNKRMNKLERKTLVYKIIPSTRCSRGVRASHGWLFEAFYSRHYGS